MQNGSNHISQHGQRDNVSRIVKCPYDNKISPLFYRHKVHVIIVLWEAFVREYGHTQVFRGLT